jgi:hypothetical protein
MIYISNALYLSNLAEYGKRPALGWHSIITRSNITATSATADRPVENLWTPDTSLAWEASGTGTIYINIDNTAAKSVDYLGIAKHNFGSGGIEYTLQSSLDNVAWSDVFAPKVVTTDRAIVHHFDSTDAPYLRLRMVAVTDAPIIAHMKLGELLILEQPMYVGHAPATLSPRAKRITNGSESGQYLGQVITRRWYESECKQENADPAWVRSNLADFIDHVQIGRADDGTAQGTFFFAWRPADYPNELIYGWTDDDIKPTNQRPNGMMEYSFSIQGVK